MTTPRQSGDTRQNTTSYSFTSVRERSFATTTTEAKTFTMMLKQIADVNFPTRWAVFRLRAFETTRTNKITGEERSETALAMILGDIHSFPPLVRIHSECLTGEVFHSLRCDCHDQLHLALHAIVEEGAGVLIYEQQEGRGIGLMGKLRAYELQDQGLDTVEANLRLGYAVDLRDYALAVQVLHFLKIRAIRLISNNPDKLNAVLSSGIDIVERMSADVQGNPHFARYLATKREKLGHLSNSASSTLANESRGTQKTPPAGINASTCGDPLVHSRPSI